LRYDAEMGNVGQAEPLSHRLSTPGKSLQRYWISALAVLAFLAYIPALRAGWIWDDHNYVTENFHLHTIHGLRELWLRPGAVPQYYPMTHTTFWVEYHLWGLTPLGYHLDNCLLHIANAVLVGLILKRLAVPGYALAAMVFAVHPVEVESVAWVTERKNVLSGFFYLLAMWQALEIWKIAPRQGGSGFSWRYPLCLLLFVLALLSKSVTASLPAIVLLLIWWKRGRIRMSEVAWLLPFFLLGLAMGLFTEWMEKHVVGALGPEWNITFPQHILIAGRAIWFYLGKIIWPYPFSFMYHRWDVNPSDALQWLYPLGLMLLLICLIPRRGLLVAALFFVVTLFPALGFANIFPMRYTFVADHYQYLASIAPIAVASAFLVRSKLGFLVILPLAFLTWQQAHIYSDSVTLWRDVVAKDPHSEIGYTNLAASLLEIDQVSDAAVQAQHALEVGHSLVETWIGPGVIAEAQKQYDFSIAVYERARAQFPESPYPYWYLGVLQRRLGHLDEARSNLQQAAKYLPNPAPAYEQLGELEFSQQNMAKAEGLFQLALVHDPDRVDSHNNLAAIYLNNGSLDAAERECRASLAINPDSVTACNNLGIALARQHRTDEAAEFFRRALAIDPNFPEAQENLKKLDR